MSVSTKALRGLSRTRPTASLLQRSVGAVRQPRFFSVSTAATNAAATPAAAKGDTPKSRLQDMFPKGDGKRFENFDVTGKVFVVTGGRQGLGLTLAEGLAEAGGKVYCLDRPQDPGDCFNTAQKQIQAGFEGSLEYRQQDVSDTEHLNELIESIAEKHQGIDGVIAAAGIQKLAPALEWTAEETAKMLAVNFTGLFMTATASARQMLKYKKRGSICFIASMSGSIANKGLLCPVYNSSKAAVVQLARNLAMEWSPIKEDGTGGIRVNCISPGHILTPMVLKNFEEVPGLREKWEAENMMGRLAETQEFKGAALFLLSNASTFTTGSNLIIDGGHTAW